MAGAADTRQDEIPRRGFGAEDLAVVGLDPHAGNPALPREHPAAAPDW